MRYLQKIVMALTLVLLSVPAVSAPAPFAEEIRLFGVEDEIYPPAGCETLFVGSSSIRFWTHLQQDFPDRKVLRRGFGGASISDINFYFDNLVGRYRPREIIFYAGENDINSGKSIEKVVADFELFMDRKSAILGQTPVYFIAAKPSIARIENFSAQDRFNVAIYDLAIKRSDLIFVDIVPSMLRSGNPRSELFISDGLHMNMDGYSIWTRAIHSALRRNNSNKSKYC